MTIQAEAKLVRDIRSAVWTAYPRAWVPKMADRFTRGMPDILIVCPGFRGVVVLLVEAKTDSGELSRIQELTHATVRRAGGEVIVARTVQEVFDKLNEMGAVA